ncbi:hypothetical protein SCLO_1009460 [Sphingobium cloacae]|uniref:Lipoprotein n=2 Tax=Sphingobium cloacae TaxID=120107 RepID=A0A1E1F0D2_9SPHN|nr:hypothetical protein SCLO_1009460 [Sphingobium cloacae]
MRIFDGWIGAGLLCLALSACGKPASEGGPAAAGDGDRIECAIGAKAGWARDCVAERQGDTLMLRHADGGFRRFTIVKDGRGLVPADGSEQAQVDIAGDRQIELTVGDNRYRLPATIAGSAR